MQFSSLNWNFQSPLIILANVTLIPQLKSSPRRLLYLPASLVISSVVQVCKNINSHSTKMEWNSVWYSRSGTLKLQPVIHILMKISLSCGHVAAEDLRSRKLSLQAPRRREQESKNTLWWESAAGDNEEITKWNPLFKQPPLVQPYGISRRWDATTNSSKQKQWNKR